MPHTPPPSTPHESTTPDTHEAPENPHGVITLGEVQIPRLDSPPKGFSDELNAILQSAFRTTASRIFPGNTNWHSKESAHAAVKDPSALQTTPDGQPASFGALTILRPGSSNIPFSPSFVFRAAQYTDKLIIAYTNAATPEKNQLVEATHVGEVPVPEALRHKIFEIGDPDKRLIASLEQNSDTFLEQLATIQEHSETLGIPVFAQANATLLGHSQGAMDALLTRKRLNDAGLPHLIGKVISLASSFDGKLAGPLQGAIKAFLKLAPDNEQTKDIKGMLRLKQHIHKHLNPEDDQLVDLSVASIAPAALSFSPEAGLSFDPSARLGTWLSDLSDGVTQALFGGPNAPSLPDVLAGNASQSDGTVTLEGAKFGKAFHQLSFPADHLTTTEHPDVIDEIIAALQQPTNEKA